MKKFRPPQTFFLSVKISPFDTLPSLLFGEVVLDESERYINYKLGLSCAKLRTSFAEVGLAIFQLTGFGTVIFIFIQGNIKDKNYVLTGSSAESGVS